MTPRRRGPRPRSSPSTSALRSGSRRASSMFIVARSALPLTPRAAAAEAAAPEPAEAAPAAAEPTAEAATVPYSAAQAAPRGRERIRHQDPEKDEDTDQDHGDEDPPRRSAPFV